MTIPLAVSPASSNSMPTMYYGLVYKVLMWFHVAPNCDTTIITWGSGRPETTFSSPALRGLLPHIVSPEHTRAATLDADLLWAALEATRAALIADLQAQTAAPLLLDASRLRNVLELTRQALSCSELIERIGTNFSIHEVNTEAAS